MPKGIGGIPTEEDIERAAKGGGRKWDDGPYTVTDLEWFDDEQHTSDGDPIYVTQQGELVARCRLIVKGEDDGPPMSVRPGQILALAKVFGVDVDKEWPDPMKDSARFLRAVERAIKKADEEITITVSGDWVSDVPGWSLPRDQSFQIVYEGCYTRNEEGEYSWYDYGYGRSVIFGLKVIGDLDGNYTPYNGWVERIFVPYRISPDPQDPSMPTFVIDPSDDGNNTPQINCYNLIQVMCPDLLENESWRDVGNIVPEWDQFAKEAKVILKVDTIWSKRAKAVKMPIWMIKPRYPDKRPYEEKETPQQVQEEEVIEKSPAIEYVYQAMTAEVKSRSGDGKAKAFGPDGKLNKAGVEVARDVFSPLINAGNLPSNIFAEWEAKDVVVALEALGYKDLARLVRQNYLEKSDKDADF